MGNQTADKGEGSGTLGAYSASRVLERGDLEAGGEGIGIWK